MQRVPEEEQQPQYRPEEGKEGVADKGNGHYALEDATCYDVGAIA